MHVFHAIYFLILSNIISSRASHFTVVSNLNRYSNLTFWKIKTLLKENGYKVLPHLDLSTEGRVGGITYQASEALPELRQLEGRADTHGAATPYLWIDDAGNAEFFYFYDSESKPNRKRFEDSMHIWSTTTCIKMTKLADQPCHNVKHGCVCMKHMDPNACESSVGNRHSINGGYTQEASVDGCSSYEAAQGFGHAMGFHDYPMRADRDQYLSVNFHAFRPSTNADDGSLEERWKKAWDLATKCEKGKTYQTSIPVPYDYLSVMSYDAYKFGDEDMNAVFVAKNPRHQHMFDFMRHAGPFTTHLDRYMLNVMYKCSDKWAAACKAQGKSPPKCQNFGYVQQNCTCACQTGTTGSSCENAGSAGALPTLGTTIVEYPDSGTFALKKYSKMTVSTSYPNSYFKYSQYATIVIKAKSATSVISVSVFEPGSVTEKLQKWAAALVSNLHKRDCMEGLMLYWGDFPSGRLRTDCFSTFVTNEPEVNAVVLRPKTPEVGLVLIGRQGALIGSGDFTQEMLESLQFTVTFPLNASSQLKVEQVNDGSDRLPKTTPTAPSGNGTSTGSGSSGGNDTIVGGQRSASSAMSKLDGISRIWIAAVPLLILVSLLVFVCRSRRAGDEETMESTGGDADDDSDSSSSDSDSDGVCAVS